MFRFTITVITLVIAAVAVPVALGYTTNEVQPGDPVEVEFAGQYFRRWNQVTNVVCHPGEVGFRGMVTEWNMPATQGTFTYTRYLNGVMLSGDRYDLNGTRILNLSASDVVQGASYPFTYRIELDTFVNGAKVYESSLQIQCSAPGTATSVLLRNVPVEQAPVMVAAR